MLMDFCMNFCMGKKLVIFVCKKILKNIKEIDFIMFKIEVFCLEINI